MTAAPCSTSASDMTDFSRQLGLGPDSPDGNLPVFSVGEVSQAVKRNFVRQEGGCQPTERPCPTQGLRASTRLRGQSLANRTWACLLKPSRCDCL